MDHALNDQFDDYLTLRNKGRIQAYKEKVTQLNVNKARLGKDIARLAPPECLVITALDGVAAGCAALDAGKPYPAALKIALDACKVPA